jgi:hypothetical protein
MPTSKGSRIAIDLIKFGRKSSLQNSFLNLLPSLFLLLGKRYEVPRGYDLMQNSFAILEGLKAM